MKTVRLTTVQALMGAKIKACDEELKIFPFDKYQQGARDQAVNLLKALNLLSLKESFDVSDPLPSPPPIDKTRA